MIDPKDGCASAVLAFLVSFPLGLVLALYSGWVAVKLWGWFVVPSFGIAPPPVVIVAGLMLLFRFASFGTADSRAMSKNSDESDGIWDSLVSHASKTFSISTVFLMSGYVLHWWASR